MKFDIYKCEYDEKYLLKYKDKIMLVGEIAKEILDLNTKKMDLQYISNQINKKYCIEVPQNNIKNIIDNVNDFFVKKDESRYYDDKNNLLKLFNFKNPYRFHSCFSFFLNFYNFFFFYITLLIFFLINTIFILFNHYSISFDLNDTLLIYILLIPILVIHEYGHIFSAKKYNTSVPEIGFAFYYIFPVLYVDLGESWKLLRKKRILINLSGIHSQLLIGAVMIIINLIINSLILQGLIYINYIIVRPLQGCFIKKSINKLS